MATVPCMSHLDPGLLAAWTATGWFHEPGPPGSPGDLESLEEAVRRRLPEALRELYLRHDGGSWLGGKTGGRYGVARWKASSRQPVSRPMTTQAPSPSSSFTFIPRTSA